MTFNKLQQNDITDDINFTPEGFQTASNVFTAWLFSNPPLESPEDLARLRALSAAYAETEGC